MCSTGGVPPIIAEIIQASGLRYLGGTFMKDLADILGYHSKPADRVVNKFLDAVDSTLQINIPTGEQELREHADAWDKVSGAQGLYYGAIAPIDGWLCCTDRPHSC